MTRKTKTVVAIEVIGWPLLLYGFKGGVFEGGRTRDTLKTYSFCIGLALVLAGVIIDQKVDDNWKSEV